jgi:hypothetical protein
MYDNLLRSMIANTVLSILIWRKTGIENNYVVSQTENDSQKTEKERGGQKKGKVRLHILCSLKNGKVSSY